MRFIPERPSAYATHKTVDAYAQTVTLWSFRSFSPISSGFPWAGGASEPPFLTSSSSYSSVMVGVVGSEGRSVVTTCSFLEAQYLAGVG